MINNTNRIIEDTNKHLIGSKLCKKCTLDDSIITDNDLRNFN